MVMRYLPAASFHREFYLPQRFGRIGNPRIKERPEISERLHSLLVFLSQLGGMAYRADEAKLFFDAETEKGPRKGYAFVITSGRTDPIEGMRGIWMVDSLGGFLAAPGLKSIAMALAENIGSGFQWSPQWQLQMTRLAGNVSRIQSQARNRIVNRMQRGYEHRSEIVDRVHERWPQTFRGQMLIEDPHSGQRLEISSGSNYLGELEEVRSFLHRDLFAPSPVLLA